MRTLLNKIIGSGFFVGMASIFCPSVIEVEPMKYHKKSSDLQNIANDWKQVGTYMTKAYGSITK